MKIILSISILFTSLVCFSQITIDVLHYRFQIKLTDQNDTIYGKATIRLAAKKGLAAGPIVLDLQSVGENGKGMQLTEPVSSPQAGDIVSRQNKAENKIYINIRSAFPDTLDLIVYYKGIPEDGLIISKNKFGKRTFFSDNWPNRARHWLPCVDNPADKASVEFQVTAPNHYQVVSNGIQIEETNLSANEKLTVYREDLPLPTKIMVIGVAEFAVSHSGLVDNCIPVTNWVFPQNKISGFMDYEMTDDILGFYTKYIAPYPYKKLANVQSKTIFGGMENASAIFYFENSVNGLRDQETLIAHEIVHQWFGNMATEKSFAHLWLSEGFATYLTHVFIESKYGKDSLAKRMEKDRNEILAFTKSSRRPVVDNTTDYMSLLNDNSYQKGSWILHMLRNEVGDSAFQKSIRLYYNTYAGKNADTKDLQKIFEQVSGKNFNTFFDQWLYTGENPELKITWEYHASKKSVDITVQQLQKKLFDFPIEFAIVDDKGKKIYHTYQVNKAENKFSHPVNFKPTDLMADPNIKLLFEGNVQQKNK